MSSLCVDQYQGDLNIHTLLMNLALEPVTDVLLFAKFGNVKPGIFTTTICT